METEEIIKVLIGVFQGDELPEAIAEFYYNLLCKLLQKGFSREEAMQIITTLKLGK